MKRLLASLLLLIYFSVTSGFVISMHFCMDRFDSAEIGSTGNDKCHKCGMSKDGHCCKDEVKVVKLNVSHLASQLHMRNASAPAFHLIHTALIASFRNFAEKNDPVLHLPPLLRDQAVYIENCVFRI
jgi:hypothetical protein